MNRVLDKDDSVRLSNARKIVDNGKTNNEDQG
jgi:hypothetical protein